jgi:hypothetical protein
MPGCKDVGKMARSLNEDQEMLEAMLADERLSRIMIDEWETAVRVSPTLLFAVLLNRVRHDLETKPYTFERTDNRMMVIFDTRSIVELLSRRDIRDYLAQMLASFAKVRSYTVSVRKRPGIWHKYRFSDLDVDSLIRLSKNLSDDRRFPVYKRIADLCLFTLAVFSEFAQTNRKAMLKSYPELGLLSGKTVEDFKEYGEYFYRAAATLSPNDAGGIRAVMEELSEEFGLAAKPLTFMADHYLGGLKTKVFLSG